MTTFSKIFLSGSSHGVNVPITTTSSPGDTLHTSHATSMDEIYLYACNIDTVSRTLTIQWGGTATGDHKVVVLPANSGDVLVVAGLPLNNSLVVKAFADAANIINMSGYVNRIT